MANFYMDPAVKAQWNNRSGRWWAGYILGYPAVLVGFGALLEWLTVGFTDHTLWRMAIVGAGAALTGVLAWCIHGRKRKPGAGGDAAGAPAQPSDDAPSGQRVVSR